MKIKSLKKIKKYRISYSGTKETDILYRKYFLKNFDILDHNDLLLIQSLFEKYSDNQIYQFLAKIKNPPIIYKDIFIKIYDR